MKFIFQVWLQEDVIVVAGWNDRDGCWSKVYIHTAVESQMYLCVFNMFTIIKLIL